MLAIIIAVAFAIGIAFAIYHGTRGKGNPNTTTTKSMLTPDQLKEQEKSKQ